MIISFCCFCFVSILFGGRNGKVLSLNSWFFVLVANFLVLLWALNAILFRPMLKVLKEREEAVKGSLEAAREMELRKEESLEELRKKTRAAHAEAREVFESMRAEGIERQMEILSGAGEEAMRMSEKAGMETRAESKRAIASIRGEVERFSDDIMRKLIEA